MSIKGEMEQFEEFKDYVKWPERKEQKEILHKQEFFRLKQFQREIPVLNLPLDYTRPLSRSFEGNVIHFEINGSSVKALKVLAVKEKAPLFMAALSLYIILLSKICQQEDIVVAAPATAGRHTDLHLMASRDNMLVLQNYPSGHKTYETFLREVKENTSAAFENRDYPFQDLVEKVAAAFIWHDWRNTAMESQGLKSMAYHSENQALTFAITLQGFAAPGKMCFAIEYDTKLFKEETLQRFARYFKGLVKRVTENPCQTLSQLDIIPETEKKKLLIDFNRTDTDYPREKTLHCLFEEQVEKTPHHIALVGGGLSLTYCELNRRSSGLAGVLRGKGVGADIIVGVMVERCPGMLIAILGILKAGGAYLPIDPAYPEKRINYMLADSNAGVLVTTAKPGVKVKTGVEEVSGQPQALSLQMIHIEKDIFNFSGSASSSLTSTGGVSPENLAYIIYTSGTTGKPKGNLISHFNVARVVKETNYIRISGKDRLLQLSNYAFDGSIFDIFGALLNGAVLVMIARQDVLAIDRFSEVISRENITVFFVTTSLFNTIVDLDLQCLKDIRQVLTGGERVSVGHIRKAWEYLGPGRVIHMYGPTESTVYATFYPVDHLGDDRVVTIPIGAPLANTSIYILNGNLKPVPLGVTGEIYIGGEGIARGYLNNPALTAEKFISRTYAADTRRNPLPPQSAYQPAHSLLYRTGDLGRWLPEGVVEFIDRIDQQVKIRGFRIELEEIEDQLLNHSQIREAVVIVKGKDSDNKKLCAYLVPVKTGEAAGKKTIENRVLREYLSRLLPDYMVPSYFVWLEQIPLNASGKVDLNALPEPEIEAGKDYVPPRDEVQEKMAALWSRLLEIKKENIGIYDNFFHLGAHSLKAAVFTARLHKELNIKVPLEEVFRSPTIAALAEYSRKMAGAKELYIPVEAEEKKEYYRLSPAQRRMFLLQQMYPDNIVYNLPQVITFAPAGSGIPGTKIHKNQPEAVIRQLLRRHDSFRTSFHTIGEEPVQRIHDELGFEIEWYGLEDRQEREPDPIIKKFIRPFNLCRAPLLRAALLRMPDNKYLLAVDMHHIIGDGFSIEIFMRELFGLYREEELPELRVGYRDYAEWLKNDAVKEKIKVQEDFWLKEFYGEVPLLNLPMDYPRPAVQCFAGNTLSFEIPASINRGLKNLAEDQGVTMYMVLMALFTILLYKLSSQEDIVVGTPAAGRRHADVQHIIGMFVNTLALRFKPRAAMPVRTFLKQVKATAVQAFENQDYPLEDLVQKIDLKRDVSRNPLFDVMFAFEESCAATVRSINSHATNSSCEPGFFGLNTGAAMFDLTLTAVQTGNRLQVFIEYCTRLFKEETIKRFSGYFSAILNAAAADPGIPINGIDMLAEVEKRRILDVFNDTVLEYPREQPVQALFQQQAERVPERLALTGPKLPGGRHPQPVVSITYRKLNQQSNPLAHLLREKGVGPDTIVGIMTDPCVEMLMGIFAVLKAGGGYLPLDPAYPGERINYIIRDICLEFLLTGGDSLPAAGIRFEGESIPLAYPTTIMGNSRNPEIINTSQHLAYIIYTSGSTGRPKGVTVEHGNLSAYTHSFLAEFPLTVHDIMLQQASFTFDTFVEEMYPVLVKGGRLVMAAKKQVRDIPALARLMVDNHVTIISGSPLLLHALGNHPLRSKSLRLILSGGDVLRPEYIRHLPGQAGCYNTYGPTETTVCAAYYKLSGKESSGIPIGKAIANYRVYIMNNHSFSPPGVPGEICIGGDGVTRGYLNNPGLTAEKFVPGDKIYKTGDLGRWLEDGNIEFLGRIDFQVKIRGFRIELGEIESRLLNHPAIKEALVVPRQHRSGDKFLCAYIVTDNAAAKPRPPELEKFLLTSLPDFMIPAHFVTVTGFPLTPAGKVDVKALPIPALLDDTVPHITARDQLEKMLVGIWAEILDIPEEKISMRANFFRLGGHSLKGAAILSRIRHVLHVDVPMVELFKSPTLEALAQYIRKEVSGRSGEEKNFLLLKPGSPLAGHFFFIHDGTGEVDTYIQLCETLTPDFNYWGIRACRLVNFAPQNRTIKQIAEIYIQKIKNLQIHGPYYIAGYCQGGIVSFEMARQLEEMGERIGFLGLIDSPPPLLTGKNPPFTFNITSELDFVKEYITNRKMRHILKNTPELETFWLRAVEYLETHHFDVEILRILLKQYGMEQALPLFQQLNLKEALYYINVARTFRRAVDEYVPTGKLRTPLCYYAAEELTEGNLEKGWRKYCAGSFHLHAIPGTHFTIMKKPQVALVAEKFSLKLHKN